MGLIWLGLHRCMFLTAPAMPILEERLQVQKQEVTLSMERWNCVTNLGYPSMYNITWTHHFKLTLQFKAVVEGLVEDLLEKVTIIIKNVSSWQHILISYHILVNWWSIPQRWSVQTALASSLWWVCLREPLVSLSIAMLSLPRSRLKIQMQVIVLTFF